MLTLSSQVEFVISVIDKQPYPSQVQPVYTLFSLTMELAAILTLVITFLALGRFVRGLGVSLWDWLVVDWGRDWRLICQATYLLFYPKGTGHYGMAT